MEEHCTVIAQVMGSSRVDTFPTSHIYFLLYIHGIDTYHFSLLKVILLNLDSEEFQAQERGMEVSKNL